MSEVIQSFKCELHVLKEVVFQEQRTEIFNVRKHENRVRGKKNVEGKAEQTPSLLLIN